MRTNRFLTISMTLLTSCAVLFIASNFSACSKSRESGSSSDAARPISTDPALLRSDLLTLIPSTNVAFGIWDTESDAYKRYRKSPWGQIGVSAEGQSFLRGFQKGMGAQGEKIRPFFDVLEQSGFVPTKPGQAEIYKQAVSFADLAPGVPFPQAGVYVNAAAGVDLTQKLKSIEDVCKQQGLTVKDEPSQNNLTVFSVETSAASAEAKDPASNFYRSVYFGATKDRLGIATSAALLQPLTGTTPAGATLGIQATKDSPEFKEALQNQGGLEDKYAFGYVDLTKVLTVARSLVTPEQQASNGFSLENVPFRSLAFSRAMTDAPADLVTLGMAPRTDAQKQWITALQQGNTSALVSATPGDALVFIGISGASLRALRDAGITTADPATQATLREQLALLDSIDSLGIALRGSSSPMPFPDVMVVARTGNAGHATELQNTLKQLVASGISSQGGIPFTGWQDKPIDGVTVSTYTSPLGIGAYLATVQDALLVSTSERFVSDAISAANKKTPALLKVLDAPTQSALEKENPAILGYANFKGLSKTLESMQGSLAMFTGGQGGLDKNELENLSRIGSAVVTVALSNNVLKVQTHYQAESSK